MEIYLVSEGDNVDQIASRFGEDVNQLVYDNQIEYPYRLAVGQALVVQNDIQPKRIKKAAATCGYAYPFISEWVLEQTLPYLTELPVFSYGFTERGVLIPPFTDDSWVIERAKEYQTVPVLTLTPLGDDGHFNNMLISRMLHDSRIQERLIWNLGDKVTEKGYGGINVDFEYVLPEDRDLFTAFVERIRKVMNVFGYRVSVALVPKTSAAQRGLLYEGMDYRGLGEAADEVFIMAYEWGYTYGPPMAVAPMNMVRRVVEYAVTEIPEEKIILGMPNYGYNWPLPFEQGVTKARTMGNIEAVQLAIDYGVPIRFDEKAQAPYYRYWQYGINHEVWFEDARSVWSSMDLAEEFHLKGMGYWHIMQLFRPGWSIINDRFDIIKQPFKM